MSDDKRPKPEEHSEQIEIYRDQEFPIYQRFAELLRRVLDAACRPVIHGAVVQARAKTLSSFAEKCVRKWEKYKHPAHELTDLCGARVIVHTLEQVKAVRAFVDANFTIVQCDDKALALGEDKFGYRDTHYLVKLRADRAEALKITKSEMDEIGGRVAELQVRTLVQHAWADIMHDRLYKAPLKLSNETKRTGALLAAIMEDGDRAFDRLAVGLDGMAANYTAHATRQEVTDEIEVQSLILHGTEEAEKSSVALHLARLLGPKGDYREIVDLLTPFEISETPQHCEILLELGHALCRLHRAEPKGADCERGRRMIERVLAHCSSPMVDAVRSPQRTRSLMARAYSRLAWVWEAVSGQEVKALENYRLALAQEPGNPYHLANQLAFEVYCRQGTALLEGMKPQIETAIALCCEHAIAGTELPFAHFAAGRLSLLMKDGIGALGWYARGLRHLFEGDSVVPVSVLREEEAWIARLHFGKEPPQECEWVAQLITLAEAFHARNGDTPHNAGPDAERVLIIAGGAATMTPEMLRRAQPVIASAVRHFSGTIISGGTNVGVPGCVGEAAMQARSSGKRDFKLVGYIPKKLPADVSKDERYDRWVTTDDEDFCPGQILRMWKDLQAQGITQDRVQVLGIGGGRITAAEFRIALALGASTAAVHCTGGAADAILNDDVWRGSAKLLGLPLDVASVQAFVTASPAPPDATQHLKMAQEFHQKYVVGSAGKLPETLRPWDELPATFKQANLAQAAYAPEILRAAGFGVRPTGPAGGGPAAIPSFADDEFKDDVERMAELEHGRWNIERLREGWRYGRPRDDANKIQPCIVPWSNDDVLTPDIKDYDRKSVRAFPEILKRAGLEIFRMPGARATPEAD